jgi:lipopolysaccharide biosynthesis glycosyltransferase
VDLPRDEAGRLKVYNAGVVTFTRASLERARRQFVPFQRYIEAMRSAGLPRFYTVDQNYFHAMMVAHLEYTELPARWNCQMHYLGDPKLPKRPIHDGRTPDAALVHVQLRGADDWSAEELHRVVNDV